MSKVFQVTMPYHGGHEHGSYESPLFSTREAAEQFKAKLVALPVNDDRRWWADYGMQGLGPEDAHISEAEVLDACPDEIDEAQAYLHITWT